MSIYRQPVSITEAQPVFDLLFRIKAVVELREGGKKYFFGVHKKIYIFFVNFVLNKTRFQLGEPFPSQRPPNFKVVIECIKGATPEGSVPKNHPKHSNFENR